jgi:hypothetical protein
MPSNDPSCPEVSVPITDSEEEQVTFRMVGSRTLEQISSACWPLSGSPVIRPE